MVTALVPGGFPFMVGPDPPGEERAATAPAVAARPVSERWDHGGVAAGNTAGAAGSTRHFSQPTLLKSSEDRPPAPKLASPLRTASNCGRW